MSDRLVSHLLPFIEGGVQILPAPLFLKDSDKRVRNYQVVNVTKVLDCVDRTRSVLIDPEDALSWYSKLCIDATMTEGAHIFRYLLTDDYVCPEVVCTFEVVNCLEGRGYTGMAFYSCDCADA